MIKEKFQFDWKSFRDHAAAAFSSSLGDPALADVTLVADGSVSLSAHKFVLSSASPVLKQFFASNPSIHSPCLFMFGVSTDVLNAILEFIYTGETVVTFENLDAFMMAAKNLQLSLNKEPEQFSNDDKITTQEEHITQTQETVLIGNKRAPKAKKTFLNDIKAETIHEKERLGTKGQGPNIKKIKSLLTLNLSEENSDIKINKVIQDKKINELYKCELCSKTFEYKTTLRNHILIRHS